MHLEVTRSLSLGISVPRVGVKLRGVVGHHVLTVKRGVLLDEALTVRDPDARHLVGRTAASGLADQFDLASELFECGHHDLLLNSVSMNV